MRARGRKLVVDGVEYRWARRHGHREDGLCQESLTAWEVERENAPLVVRFADGDGAHPTAGEGWGGGVGLVLIGRRQLNLHRPAVAAALIRAALRAGWDPAHGKPYVIAKGAAFIAQHAVPFER